MQQKLLTPEEIAAQQASEIPFLRMPARDNLFSERAARLRQLANGHPMGDYLRFIARLAEAQQGQLNDYAPVRLPDGDKLRLAHEHGMPPLAVSAWPRDPSWRFVLRRIVEHLIPESSGTVLDTLMRLQIQSDDSFEAQAGKLLNGITFGLDRASAPFLAAALQVYWTHMASLMGKHAFARIDVPNVCPCCGSRATASIARIGARESGYRYLYCSLCAAEWHMVRIKCTNCDTTKSIHYLGIEGGSPAVKAECCDECSAYLKIFYMEKDNQVEPVADDLASLSLDLLVAEQGKMSSGINLMLIHGEADD